MNVENENYGATGLETIRQACQQARDIAEIWNEGLFRIYAGLKPRMVKAQAKALLKSTVKQLKCPVKEFERELDGYAAQRAREDRAATSNAFKMGDMKREILTGEYMVDENGVYKFDDYGHQINVCNNPIYIEREIEPLDDAGNIYVELKYLFKGSAWKKIIIPKHVISDHREITALIEYGIDATTENAGALIQYLRTLQNWNVGARAIPTTPGCGRFGWVSKGDERVFMPYGAEFTGETEYQEVFRALRASGTFDKWRETIRPYYEPGANQIPRIALAAAAAAPIVGYMKELSFFVHLHGVSGHGKTVTLMLAASLWGNPKGLVQTFSATLVGMERRAAVMCNVPVMLDEIGTYDAKSKEISLFVYQLTEGAGKVRGTIKGLQQNLKWSTVFLSTGEQPLTSNGSQAGVINRVISVDCNGTDIYENPNKLLEIIRQNYGHAGYLLTEKIRETGESGIHDMQKAMKELLQIDMPDGMNKQLMAASWLMVADQMLQSAVFGEILDGDTQWLIEYIKTKEEVSNLVRGLQILQDWRVSNGRHFYESSSEAATAGTGGAGADVWGFKCNDGWAYVPQKARETLSAEGMNYDAFVSEARVNGAIKTGEDGKRVNVKIRMGARTARFLVVKSDEEEHKLPIIRDIRGEKWRQSLQRNFDVNSVSEASNITAINT